MLLSDGDRVALERKLGDGMKDEVTLTVFVSGASLVSKDLADTAATVASFSPKIKVRLEDVQDGRNQLFRDMHLENWPVLVLTKEGFNRIRYYGNPTGYELPAIVDAIVELSKGSAQLSPKAIESLSKVRRRANIKVFVLVTCPFCPTVARHAYRAAIGSERVVTEVIDSSAFRDLAARHTVMGVPKMILNDSLDITGAVTESEFMERLRDADQGLLDSMYG